MQTFRIRIKENLRQVIAQRGWLCNMYNLIGREFTSATIASGTYNLDNEGKPEIRFQVNDPSGTWSIPYECVEILKNKPVKSKPTFKPKKRKSYPEVYKVGQQVITNSGNLVLIDGLDKYFYYDINGEEIDPGSIDCALDKPFMIKGEVVEVIDGELLYAGECVPLDDLEEFFHNRLYLGGYEVEIDGKETMLDILEDAKYVTIGCQTFKAKHLLKLYNFLCEYDLIG